MDGEGAPPGGPGAQAATMRVNEKYSTLPAEDRSVHIINICAIEDIGYLPSEGTVSAGDRQPRSPGRAAHLRRPRGGWDRRRRVHGALGAWGAPSGARGPRRRHAPTHPGPESPLAAASPQLQREPEPAAGARGGALPSRWCRFGATGGGGEAASPREGGSL